MDGFDPFENHENVLGKPQAQVDPFSWNDNLGEDLSIEGIDGALNVDPQIPTSTFSIGHTQNSSGEAFQLDKEDHDDIGHHNIDVPIQPSNKEITDVQHADDESFGDTIGGPHSKDDSYTTGDVTDPLPRITVSDTPDGPSGANMDKKVNCQVFCGTLCLFILRF